MRLGLIILSDNLAAEAPFCFPAYTSLAPSLSSVNAQVCGFVEWHSVFQVKLVAQLLTWLVNGCYLWEEGVDPVNIAHSHLTSLPLLFPFFPFFPLGSTADGNGCDDRGNKEETQMKKYGDGEIWKGNQEE